MINFQSGEWITVKLVEAQPDLTSIGNDLQEAVELQTAHSEVLRQLKNKATPVEELMRQVDKKVSSQRPEPEVYAAMAESLGTAWQSINNHLEHRKQILDLSVTFQTNFEQCLQRMEALNIICRDEELPIQIDAVKQALTEIHDLRRSVLESVMAALQEGGHLLDHLKDLNNIGTLDSRPGQIKPSIGSAIKQVESWLEAMHDRRKILEISWQNRKNRLEQCLALAMLARDLHELEDAIREHKERIGSDIYLGESEYETSMLIVDINNFLKEVKELQERAIKITRATEQLVKSGCFAGREASDKAYSVLGGCSDFLNDLESRETLLTRAQAFYENGRQVLNRLDDFEREVRQNDLVGMLPRLTPVTITNAVDEITQDVIREGRDLLTECGVNNPGSQGVRNLLEEIENRAIELRRKCDEMRRTDRKIGEALFAFQEKQDELSSWLRTISEISLKERRDMGHDLPTAKDFYSFHHELLKNLEIKGNEINALLLTLPPILEYLDDEQRREVDRKVESLHENWTTLKALVELRLDLSSVFVQFLTDADKLSAEFDTLDQLLVRSSAHSMEDKIRLMDVQWNVIKPLYDQLKNSGTGFKRSAEQRAVSDRHLAIGTACSLIDEILNGSPEESSGLSSSRRLGARKSPPSDRCTRVINWISKLDSNIYPVLTSPTSNASELVAFAESTLQRVTNEIVQAQNDIQTKLRLTEDLVAQDTSLLDETQPVKNNLQELQQKLNTTSTEYKLLVQSIISFLRNVAELDKSIENIQSKHRLPVDLQTDLENFAKDHEASKKIIMEMFKQQEPKLAAQHDIEKILTMLEHRKSCFEASWNATKLALDESMKTGQFDADLKDINSTLDDLVRQLASVRGQYGETLATAKASSLAFEYFERTIELLQNRIDGFVSSSNEIFSDQTKDYPRIKRDLDALSSRWNGFRHEVSEVRRLIDLSMQYFKLVDETEDWFGEGNKLLLTVASKIATIKTEDDANKLLSEMEHFISSGEYKQNERLNKMSALARDLYDDSRYSHLNKIQNSNRDMMTSFETMRDNLRTAIDNLKAAAIERDEVDRSLAEKAKLEAELLAQSEMIQQITVKTTTSESQTVDLGKAPEFTVLLTDAVVPEGSKFTFECQVVGDPEPDVTWYKDGMSIQNNPDYKTVFENGKCSLTIEETFTEDSAKFRCKAINNYGSADTCATLSVRETDVNTLLQPPQFVELLKPGKAMEGKSFQFECKVIGNPLPTVQWYKNDVCIDNSKDYGITYNNGEAVLRFEEVFLEDHALYMCKATNDAGIDQCQAYLMVEPLEPTEKPVFVIPLSNTMARAGQKVKLECQVSGIPEPQIQWTHNGKPFMETSDSKLHRDGQRATLIINEAFPKDAGLYAATARNIAGTVTSSCNVSVKGLLPNETSDSEQPSDMEPIKPSVQMPLQDRSAFERDSVRFDCIIVGQPEPEVIWYHNDRPVKESSEFQLLFQGDRCSLIIREVFSEDAGVYKVVAINSAGEASSTCILKVNKPQEVTPPEKVLPTGFAPKFTRLLTDVLVPENEKVLLECEVTGDPKPYVKWYHNTRELISNERYDICLKDDGVVSLTILQVHPDDKGLYTVKAFNTNGDAKCFANLIVKSVNVGDSQKPVQIQAEFGYIAPQFKELFSDCKVPDGCPAKFECIVTGKPTPRLNGFLIILQ
ncbi:coiled-coil domain-containing protein 141-like [Ctenocephalides felis]|uniref:coiled-coil domain-containing protein 141-like n=1 Tax=Ctenocephalides felis TaxID=7515 RepID=UPI000E6E433E|nr:coiled-coil domain-containing protein 141-like [Ctenocephalides felis]